MKAGASRPRPMLPLSTAGQAELKTARESRVPDIRVGQPGGSEELPRSAGEAEGHRDGVMSTFLSPEARRGKITER